MLLWAYGRLMLTVCGLNVAALGASSQGMSWTLSWHIMKCEGLRQRYATDDTHQKG